MEFIKKIIKLNKEYIEKDIKGRYWKIAKIINEEYGTDFGDEAIRSYVRRYSEKENELDVLAIDAGDRSLPVIEYTKGGVCSSTKEIHVSPDTKITPKLLLDKHGFDSNKFELVSAGNRCTGTVKMGKETVESYSSRITVKPIGGFVWTQEVLDNIMSGIKIDPCLDDYDVSTIHNGKALVLPIVDMHYALKSTIEASGNEYDKGKAKDYLFRVIKNTLGRTQDELEKIYFIIGNDIMNIDNKAKTTTSGTPQDVDGDVETAVAELTDMLIEAVDILKKISKVEVVHVPSNHDYMVAYGIVNALRIRYLEDDNVNIDTAFIQRKYKTFGNVLMGFSHDLNPLKVNDIIQSDARELMGKTSKSIYFLGHLHHEESKDVNGTDVRRLPTFSGNSRWSYEKGYSSIKKSQAFIIDKEHGITDIIYTILE